MKVGIFGGSFDPIHNFHTKIIGDALESKVVDEVWVIPCKRHAFGKNLSDSKHRVKMIEYAIKGMDHVRVDSTELDSEGVNYTIDTVRKLKSKYDHDFYFMAGSDAVSDLPSWKDGAKLRELIDFLVFERKGYSVREDSRDMTFYEKPLLGTSSTEIRERVAADKPIYELVHEDVEKYILREGLYHE
ncbi:nicotinate (nicotinamide) nucleotide adenylyltransferase [archaeon]|jgi:nicotinate-nucleotide adenylyltransferase|nr:nicotinate (nicotinamide) nucleotide adenylyltransferase [archaeon]MBT7128483.1 nicotinate (nicotinamide) nucleotide adenylyltransferase [archaeon]